MFTISSSKKTRRTFTETAEVALRALGSDAKFDQKLIYIRLELILFRIWLSFWIYQRLGDKLMFTMSNSKKTRRTFTETAEVALRACGSDTKVGQRLIFIRLKLILFTI